MNAACARAVDAAHAAFGGLDVSGEQRRLRRAGPLDQLSDAALREVSISASSAPPGVTRAAMRLRAAAAGMCSMSSILGFDGAAEGWGAYAAASSRWAA